MGHAQGVYDFQNVFISTGIGEYGSLPLISLGNGELIPETLDEQLYWYPHVLSMQGGSAQVAQDVSNRKNILCELNSHYLNSNSCDLDIGQASIWLAHSHGWYPYGHLHDSLSRLFRIRHLLKDENITFLCSRWDRVKDFQKHLSACVGRNIHPSSIICINNYRLINCKKIIFSLPAGPATNFTKASHEWLFNSYIAHFGIQYASSKVRPLYLSRNHVVPGKRGVSNEPEVLEYLQAYNVKIVTGSEPLCEIIDLFFHANFIVAPHGSLLASTIFCRAECFVLEYCASNRVDRSFMLKTKNVTDYNQFLVAADSDYNINIDLGALALAIESRLTPLA